MSAWAPNPRDHGYWATTVTPITAASAGTVPSGYTAITAANIVTTATYPGTDKISTCFIVGATLASDADFAKLSVFHFETGAWVDRTLAGSHVLGTRKVCARTTTLSPFAVLLPTATAATLGGGGGCAMLAGKGVGNGKFDPSLPLLLLLAGVYGLRRRVR